MIQRNSPSIAKGVFVGCICKNVSTLYIGLHFLGNDFGQQ